MTHTLDDFVRRRERGADLLLSLASAAEAAGLASDAAYLRATADRARAGRFVVLLLGCFSSGKSTLVNALVGEPVLPVKVNPCTAILTEVVYADAPAATVRYADGRAEQLDIASFAQLFQLRTATEEEAGAEASDRFGDVERAAVGVPMPLLRHGVVLLDTPGLDDDPIRTARTLSSLADADAVIVVLSANRFLTDLERRTLRRDLLPLGLRNLFFPVTMVDLLASLADDPEAARRELVARGREVLGPLCDVGGVDRFAERFFPLDARAALGARWDRSARQRRDPEDEAALAQSGMAPFEDALEAFLVQERGAAQLGHLHTAATRIRDEIAKSAAVDEATAQQSVESLRRRLEELEPAFRELATIARRVARTVDSFVDRQKALIWQDLRDFMARTEADLPDAVARFDLGGLAGLDLLTARGRARVEAALRRQLETWVEGRVGEWQLSLRPRIEGSLRQLRGELAADAADFDALADSIVTDFAGGALRVPGAEDEAPKVDPVERWFSVAMGAVLLSPGTMAAGWADGYEGALRGAASRLGVRLAVLTIGALLGPVGWLGLVLYAVSDAVLLVLTGGAQLRRLRDQVAERLRGQLVAQVDGARADIEARVAQGLGPVRDGLVGAAEAEARDLEALLARTVAARDEAVRDAAARAGGWREALAAFDGAVAELDALRR